MKNLKFFSIFMLLSICTLAFISCEEEKKRSRGGGGSSSSSSSTDDSTDDGSTTSLTARDIEGEWVRETSTTEEWWYFGDGEFEYEYYDTEYYYEYEYWGTYTVSKGKLNLTFEDNIMSGEKESLSISLKGDILTIDGVEYERYDYYYDYNY